MCRSELGLQSGQEEGAASDGCMDPRMAVHSTQKFGRSEITCGHFAKKGISYVNGEEVSLFKC